MVGRVAVEEGEVEALVRLGHALGLDPEPAAAQNLPADRMVDGGEVAEPGAGERTLAADLLVDRVGIVAPGPVPEPGERVTSHVGVEGSASALAVQLGREGCRLPGPVEDLRHVGQSTTLVSGGGRDRCQAARGVSSRTMRRSRESAGRRR